MKELKRVHFRLPRNALNESKAILPEVKIAFGTNEDIIGILLRMMYRIYEHGEGGETYGTTGEVA